MREEWLVEASERALDQWIRAACEGRLSSDFRARVPVPGGFIEPPLDAESVRSVGRALAAAAWHEETSPWSWSKPLPVEMGVCESLMNNRLGALQLLGYFGRSLRWNNWDTERHPVFDVFCCGVMEDFRSPMDIRTDKELQQMFPPRALAGIVTPLCWRPPGT